MPSLVFQLVFPKMTCYRFSSGVEFMFMAIFAFNFLSISIEASAFEQSSPVWRSPIKMKLIRYLVYMLDMHSNVIHMEVIKIESADPQCVVIVESTNMLQGFDDFQYESFRQVKRRLKHDHNFSFLEFLEFQTLNPWADRSLMFTHKLIQHKLRECNSAAFEAPRDLTEKAVHWSNKIYKQEIFKHQNISSKSISVLNRRTGNTQPFNPIALRNMRERKRKSFESNRNEASSSTAGAAERFVPKKIARFDLNQLPKEWDFSWQAR